MNARSFLILIPFFFFHSLDIFGSDKKDFEKAYQTLQSMLEGKEPIDFQKAVFTIENAWYGNTRKFSDFRNELIEIAATCRMMIAKKGIGQYKTAGNWAVFMWMTQKIPENGNRPITYDFDDVFGGKDFSNTFVTRTLRDKKGNCMSMPLLYKCIAQELQIEAKLTIGPNHAWIRHIDENGKWSNIELTSGQFPTDGVLMTDLNITREAVKSGAYFTPLSPKESIAFLLTQLALSYEKRFGKVDSFSEKCADLSIKYFPPNAVAYMIKANYFVNQAQEIIDTDGGKEELEKLLPKFKKYSDKLNEMGITYVSPEEYNSWVTEMKNHNPKK